jgi:hypothetical protein
LFLTTHED